MKFAIIAVVAMFAAVFARQDKCGPVIMCQHNELCCKSPKGIHMCEKIKCQNDWIIVRLSSGPARQRRF